MIALAAENSVNYHYRTNGICTNDNLPIDFGPDDDLLPKSVGF